MNKFVINDIDRFEISFEQPIRGTAFSSQQKAWDRFLEMDLGVSVFGFTSGYSGKLNTEIDEYNLKPYMYPIFRTFEK